jgi:hypothetical protein
VGRWQGQPDYVTEPVACVLCEVMVHAPVDGRVKNSTTTTRSRLARHPYVPVQSYRALSHAGT